MTTTGERCPECGGVIYFRKVGGFGPLRDGKCWPRSTPVTFRRPPTRLEVWRSMPADIREAVLAHLGGYEWECEDITDAAQAAMSILRDAAKGT